MVPHKAKSLAVTCANLMGSFFFPSTRNDSPHGVGVTGLSPPGAAIASATEPGLMSLSIAGLLPGRRRVPSHSSRRGSASKTVQIGTEMSNCTENETVNDRRRPPTARGDPRGLRGFLQLLALVFSVAAVQQVARHLQAGDALRQRLGERLRQALGAVEHDQLIDAAERLRGRLDDRRPMLGQLLADDSVLILGQRV